MLKNLDPEEYDLACIQEPYLNLVNLVNASNLQCYWDVLYPSNHHAKPNRSLMSTKLSIYASWQSLLFYCSTIAPFFALALTDLNVCHDD